MHHDRIHLSSKALFPSTAPFSHIVIAKGTGHVAGIVGQRRDTGVLVAPETETQTRAMFDNLETALIEAGFGLRDIVATRLYLADYADFDLINAVYRERLSPLIRHAQRFKSCCHLARGSRLMRPSMPLRSPKQGH